MSDDEIEQNLYQIWSSQTQEQRNDVAERLRRGIPVEIANSIREKSPMQVWGLNSNQLNRTMPRRQFFNLVQTANEFAQQRQEMRDRADAAVIRIHNRANNTPDGSSGGRRRRRNKKSKRRKSHKRRKTHRRK